MHERAPRGRFCLSEYAPNHAWRTKGGISGKSHIRKWAICRKNENLTLWKCARMHERAPRGRFLLSEYAPNHAWHTKGGINGKSHIRKCIICRKNEHFTVWKCMKRRLVGKKAIFQYWEFPEMPPSQEGVGHAWRFFNVACFDATSYCKYEQTWPDSISAKDQEKNFLSIFPVRCGRIESDVIDSWFLGCVKSRRCANQFAYTLLFYSLKREGF